MILPCLTLLEQLFACNGSEEAKKHADYVTTSNDEDGISNAFEKFL